MSKSAFIPTIITATQIAGLLHLWYAYTYLDGQIPISFMELNVLAIINAILLIFLGFNYSKTIKKHRFWLLPISIAIFTISMLLIGYLVMGIDKYQ